jgi:hypothetical protein
MDITVPPISVLKRQSKEENPTELIKRALILWYIYFNKGVYVPECITAKINNIAMFEDNLNIARGYFLSFVDE